MMIAMCNGSFAGFILSLKLIEGFEGLRWEI
jgi:hypothetical protein